MKKCFGLFLCLFILGCSNNDKQKEEKSKHFSTVNFKCFGTFKKDYRHINYLIDEGRKYTELAIITNDLEKAEKSIICVTNIKEILVHIANVHGDSMKLEEVKMLKEHIEIYDGLILSLIFFKERIRMSNMSKK